MVPVHVQNFFFFWGGRWQAVSLGGGVTVMERRKILVGWVTKVRLKCTKKLEYGGRVTFDNIFKSSWKNQTVICLYDCNYCMHSINVFKLTNVMSFSAKDLWSFLQKATVTVKILAANIH